MSLSVVLCAFLNAYIPVSDAYSPFTPVPTTKLHKLSHKQPSAAHTRSRRKVDNIPDSPSSPTDSSSVQTASSSLSPPPPKPSAPVAKKPLIPAPSLLPPSSLSTPSSLSMPSPNPTPLASSS